MGLQETEYWLLIFYEGLQNKKKLLYCECVR